MSLIINQEHEQILKATGHVLVTGGPGSGKTTIALQKAIDFIQAGKLKNNQNVLFLSFSKAAVARIKETAKLKTTNNDYQKFLSIQTFHSFFWEIIKTHGYLLGAPHRLSVLPPHDEDALRQGRQYSDKGWIEEQEGLFYTDGKVCFDLFAPLALQILLKSKAILNFSSKKFPLIVVDEAQDTDSEQWECIKMLTPYCQILLLADLDQQIHDYRADVTPERISNIITDISPLQISLSGLNHRSSGTAIMNFGLDILNNNPTADKYNGVSILNYSPLASQRDLKIRQCLGILYKKLSVAVVDRPVSVAVLCTWGIGVKIVSHALRGSDTQREIRHRVQFDETATYLSSRLIAFLLEPDDSVDRISQALNIMCDLYRAKGKKTEWEKYENWCKDLETKGTCRGNVVSELKRIMQQVKREGLRGDPVKDWIYIKGLLFTSSSVAIREVGKNAELLMVFNRGKIISRGLTQRWQEQGAYHDARMILDAAIVESQIMSENNNQNGINVMTIHKAKGKEFDGVILFNNSHSSPFVLRNDTAPFLRSRKLIYVGVTRARYQAVILNDASCMCPIVHPFGNLN